MWLTVAGVVGLTPLAGYFEAIIAGPILSVWCLDQTSRSHPTWSVSWLQGVRWPSVGCSLTLLLIAVGRGGAVIFPWVGALVVGFVWATLGPGPPLGRVTSGIPSR